MDLLEQYEQQNPEKFREQKSAPVTDAYGREYTGMIALAMRLSGGRIRDARQASYALLVFAGVVIIVSLFLFFGGGTAGFSPDWTPYRDNDGTRSNTSR